MEENQTKVLFVFEIVYRERMTIMTVKKIVDEQLCCACGACEGICPRNAVLMSWNTAGFLSARIDETKCIDCGLCAKVCPSNSLEMPVIHKNVSIAVCGHALDPDIWRRGQSGGIGTALLLRLLSSGAVDGVVISKLVDGIPRALYTEDFEEIKSAAGSIYCQTAVVETVLRNREKRMAIVCLGCQSKALRKAISVIHGLADRIFIIGLICGGNMSLLMKDDLLNQMNAENGVFRYRDKENTGWPGNPTCETTTGIKTLDKIERIKLKPVYEPYRCIVCPDKMNVYSDILIGDPWGLKEDENIKGMTVAMAYTQKGEEILRLCDESIVVHGIDEERVRKGQNEAGIITRLYDSAIIAKKNRYALPFRLSNYPERPYNRELSEQINFARRLYNSKDSDVVSKLIRRRKKKMEKPLLEVLYSIKKRFI